MREEGRNSRDPRGRMAFVVRRPGAVDEANKKGEGPARKVKVNNGGVWSGGRSIDWTRLIVVCSI
jgi:hypothetical protein